MTGVAQNGKKPLGGTKSGQLGPSVRKTWEQDRPLQGAAGPVALRQTNPLNTNNFQPHYVSLVSRGGSSTISLVALTASAAKPNTLWAAPRLCDGPLRSCLASFWAGFGASFDRRFREGWRQLHSASCEPSILESS